ncbi:MAG: hypothetical protein Q7T50_03835, partial [Candidatus Magasanikbacteria bacterium]|nr:hypothetical protein [Candidatus Magasanikbacteria bacterium]
DAAFIITRLSYEVRNATAITTPSTIGQTTSSLNLTSGSETHTFSLSGNDLIYQKTVGASVTSNNLNTSLTNVSNLTFQALGFSGGKLSVKIHFVLTEVKATQQGNKSKTYEIITTTR